VLKEYESEAQMAHVDAETAAETRYKIGDVCRIADVQPYVLRYWESEFAALAADRSQSGPRSYSARELKVIEQIKRLLYDEGYTIAGAKKRLESEALAASRAEVAAPEKPERGKKSSSSSHAAAGAAPARSDTAPVHALKLDKSDRTEPVVVDRGKAAAPAPDARLPRVVAELKDILKVLDRK
jgi:DNA-binding transcriptional MerR regulator